jgi:hypothetical protein
MLEQDQEDGGHILSPLVRYDRRMRRDDGGHYAYSVNCSCGWRGVSWTMPEGAYRDGIEHIDANA